MSPEVAEAIRIADKHLAGFSVECRQALAIEIVQAIVRHAELVAIDAIKTATNTQRYLVSFTSQ